MASSSERPQPPKRPWYLVVALIVCSLLGGIGSLDGWEKIAIYRGTPIDTAHLTHDLVQEADRKVVSDRVDGFLAAMDESKPKLFPLAVAEVVLGSAMFVLSILAVAGRRSTRLALLQLAIAQAALVVAIYVIAPRVRWTWDEVVVAEAAAKQHERGGDPQMIELGIRTQRAFMPILNAGMLGARTLVVLFVVLALTRPRARAFFEAQGERPNEG